MESVPFANEFGKKKKKIGKLKTWKNIHFQNARFKEQIAIFSNAYF
jgi:hypothetical protein